MKDGLLLGGLAFGVIGWALFWSHSHNNPHVDLALDSLVLFMLRVVDYHHLMTWRGSGDACMALKTESMGLAGFAREQTGRVI